MSSSGANRRETSGPQSARLLRYQRPHAEGAMAAQDWQLGAADAWISTEPGHNDPQLRNHRQLRLKDTRCRQHVPV